VGSATFTNSDINTGPNEAFDGWGDGIAVRRNLFHGFSAATGNHNDAFQTWEFTNDDGAEGPPLTNCTLTAIACTRLPARMPTRSWPRARATVV
jgi:hypothetical protein